ncbi:HpcH/HpaI aldolase family protein [Shimia marina]|uniref:4-hydroxy-2-oxo-heptane-1,7-dioate aldolase n=1 Tax=Shimia marina TaxID=321267 RepID=A0A0P1EPQ2_9RHOB|nr:aldolase/citrate lyase family protein [Shimia marina]CUH52030.1 4-hydroxy-2-oxo-heptane-1,7-dioate aldolase [Shimia marina]SFE61662.1 4-hydroxy-2-oxoheptanedioate aldolase [Shimia marina]
MPHNPFLQALRDGKPQIGLWVTLADALTTEVVAGAGYDWLLLDMEHSAAEISDVTAQLQACHGYASTAIVRPDWKDPVKVTRLLDLGAPGLLFPMVQTAEEAAAAVAATRYAPRGTRGFAGTTRASDFGRNTAYAHTVEDQTAVLLQVESLQALNNIEAIANTEGVDGIFFGPDDIAADMGLIGQPMHDDVWAQILPAAMRLMSKKMPVGTMVGDVTFARKLVQAGFTFVACGSDAGLLAKGADALLAQMKAPQ